MNIDLDCGAVSLCHDGATDADYGYLFPYAFYVTELNLVMFLWLKKTGRKEEKQLISISSS